MCGRLHGHADSFKVLSEFIDRNSNLETDDVTGEKLSAKNDVTKDIDQGLVTGAGEEGKIKNDEEINSKQKNNIDVVPDTESSSSQSEAAEHGTEAPDDITYSRIRLPKFDDVKVNQTFITVLPGDIEVQVKVLSLSPFIFGKYSFPIERYGR